MKNKETLLEKANKGKWLYILAIVLALLFVVIRLDFLAVGAALMFILGVIAESVESAKEKGIMHELREIAIAIAVALVVLFIASVLLGTSSPFNAVVSCSMLNTLQRGDVVLLQNAPIKTEEITITREQFSTILKNGEEHYVCGKCSDDGATVRPCSINPKTGLEATGEVLQYKCSFCHVTVSGKPAQIVCTEGVTIAGRYVNAVNRSGDIIVYRPKPDDLFSEIGDIIHRAILRIRVDGESYYLIKGDNNPMFDVQAYDIRYMRTNSIVNSSQVLGRSWLTIPLIGYVKLVGAGQLALPSGCEMLLGEPIHEK
ncbi:MAG: hypothetical protein N3G76_02455 [Candidatus Micrarchaeota archaeon]|nr:hypothetical protein [Candidatus Micrarchaeota archaeon]